jgi:hypothetical protein
MSLLDRIADCATFDPTAYRPWRIDGKVYGLTAHAFADALAAFQDVFDVDAGEVRLATSLTTSEARTKAVAGVLETLRDHGLVPGWRGEHYPVSRSFHAEPVLTIERAAVSRMGSKGYGVHLNGYVRKNGGIHMWVGKRSMRKPTGPGKLDQMVAGGQPIGISVHDNLIKECAEEAGMPVELATTARPVGTVSYLTERPDGLRHDVLFNYDIELPHDFEPTPTDGEVDAFYLWPIEEIIERMREADDFKFNAALVIIDFAVRHAVIGPDDPEYIGITEGMHMGRAGDLAMF